MKLTNNPKYFDFNATTPLADSVKKWISSGDLIFANPASFHSLGKKSKAIMAETSDYLLKHFNLDKTFDVFFHSGATEGMNTFIKGMADHFAKKGERLHFFYSGVDHSCTRQCAEFLSTHGHVSTKIEVNRDGQFSVDQVIAQIKKAQGPVLYNFLWCNNETGVVWPLELAVKIKRETGCFVHVDAAQVVGKVPHYDKLSMELDAYSYSGHKFGVMKGIGVSFFKPSFPFSPLMLGGGQQHGFRSGTENPWVYCLKLALQELKDNLDFTESLKARDYMLVNLPKVMGDKGEIVAKLAPHRNSQTISVIFNNRKADETMTILDLSNVQVSSGAACSSGIVRPSPVLMHMGYPEDQAKCGIRFSFSPYWTQSDAEIALETINQLLQN